ncbi:MAG: tetratricopeptide repeat protein, partial [Chthoniobacterales bacterium]
MYVLDKNPNDSEAARVAAEAAHTPEEIERVKQALDRMADHNSASFQLAFAAVAARRGDSETVKSSVQRALELDPKSAPAHSAMGTLWLLQKQPVKAGDEFKTASELSQPRSLERLRYAQFQIQTGATDPAWNTLRESITKAPDFISAWLLLAELSLGKKNYDETLKLLANVLNRDPENIDGTILEARARMGKGEVDKGIQGLERLDGRYPNFPPLKCELARFYLQKNNGSQAIKVLNDALTANPEYLDAAVLLGQINLRTGKPKAVIEAMKTLLAKHPEVNAAKLLLADAYRALGQLDDAAAIFREELARSPNNAEACVALGVILRQQKKTDEAQQVLERARQLAPNNPIPLLQLVDIQLGGRHFEAAHQLVKQQLDKTPNAAVLDFLEGKIFSEEKNWDMAERSLNEAIKLNPNFTDAYGLLAIVYTSANKLPEAIHQLEAIVAKDPKNARAQMALAVLYEKTSAFDKARVAYEKVIELQPEAAAALNNLAFIYTEHFNQLDRAYQLAQKARSLQPGDVSIADTLGWVLYKKRDFQQALGLLTDAAAKAPNNPEIQYHVGMCHYMMGSTDASRAAFEAALRSPADFPGKADAQRRLALISQGSPVHPLTAPELESLVRQRPDDVLARLKLAEADEAAGSFKQAADQYQEALKINPRLAPAVIRLAHLYSNALNDQAKALELAKTARELRPGDAQVTLLLGRIALKSGNDSWAYGLLNQASDQLANDPEAHHAFGWAAFRMGKIPEATEQMKRVTELAPRTPLADDATTWLMMIRLGNDPQSPQASEKVAELLRKNPQYEPAEVAQAAIAYAGGEVDRAARIYEQVVSQMPEYTPAQKQLAAIYATRPDNLAKAYDLAMKVRKISPDDPEIARTLADISYRRKEYARALELFEESARRQPLDASHLYYMGICSLQTKDNAQARDALSRALASGLQDPLAADARRALQSIGRD